MIHLDKTLSDIMLYTLACSSFHVDGKSNSYPLTYAAPALKNSGVQVYTIGIGNYDLNELLFISSDPDNEHVFVLKSYRDALGFVDVLSVTTCESELVLYITHVFVT